MKSFFSLLMLSMFLVLSTAYSQTDDVNRLSCTPKIIESRKSYFNELVFILEDYLVQKDKYMESFSQFEKNEDYQFCIQISETEEYLKKLEKKCTNSSILNFSRKKSCQKFDQLKKEFSICDKVEKSIEELILKNSQLRKDLKENNLKVAKKNTELVESIYKNCADTSDYTKLTIEDVRNSVLDSIEQISGLISLSISFQELGYNINIHDNSYGEVKNCHEKKIGLKQECLFGYSFKRAVKYQENDVSDYKSLVSTIQKIIK